MYSMKHWKLGVLSWNETLKTKVWKVKFTEIRVKSIGQNLQS